MGQAKLRRQAEQVSPAKYDQELRRLRNQAGRTESAAAARALFEETAARPEVQAVQAAALADEELQARLKADTPGQCERLARLGWRQVQEGNDGAGWWSTRVAR